MSTLADAALTPILMQFALAYGCMLVIPGPNTLMVLRACDGSSARGPVMAAVGVACGATLASIVAASSAAVLPSGSAFRAISRVIVAAILLRAALRSSRQPQTTPAGRPVAPNIGAAPFLLGFGASVFNPVSVPYFASFFVSHDCSHRAAALACALVFTMAGGWFSLVGLASTQVRRLRFPPACREALNWAMVVALVGLAVHHLWAALG